MAKTKTMPMDVRGQAGELASKIGPRVEQAREMAGPMIAEAREKAGPMIAEAREKAGPALQDARDRLGERLTNDVLPALTAAVAAADHATEDVREEARRRGLAAAAALRGEVEPPKQHHRIRTLMVLLGLGAVAAAVAKMLSDRQASTAWQSSYTPPPAPASAPSNDEAGATPDVAAADAASEPHGITTPDNPLAQTDLPENKTD
jgi:F0F1-type ATP synthase membrane subunit b/b'